MEKKEFNREEVERIVDEARRDPQNIIKMIQYYTKSARFGWVYAFNNLYAVLSNKEIEHIKNDVKVRKTLKEAYDVLTTDEIISSKVDARRKNEEEFIAIKKKYSRSYPPAVFI